MLLCKTYTRFSRWHCKTCHTQKQHANSVMRKSQLCLLQMVLPRFGKPVFGICVNLVALLSSTLNPCQVYLICLAGREWLVSEWPTGGIKKYLDKSFSLLQRIFCGAATQGVFCGTAAVCLLWLY